LLTGGLRISGIAETNGEIISWLSADDLYAPWAYKTVDMWMKRPGVSWLMGMPSIWDPNGCMRCVYPHNHKPRSMIKQGFFHPGFLGSIQAESTFFKRTIFQNLTQEQINSIAELKLAGDFLLWRTFAESTKLHLVPSVLGGFRIQGSNSSIESFDAYIDEVKSTKAICLSRSAANLASSIYNRSSAVLMKSKSIKENRRLNESLGLK